MDASRPIIHLAAQLLPLFCLLVTALLVYTLSIRFRKGLRDLPGPFWASILPLDRMISVAKGHQFKTHLNYHRKYGPLVRIGPNHVSFSDAEALSTVYGITTKFHKSDYYRAFDAKSPVGNLPTVFSIRDEIAHRALKRPVANAYSMGTMVELEPLTDICIRILEEKLDGLQGRDIDFGEWLHWFSFDVITSITFSNRLGFMEQEKDVGGIIEAIEGRLMYNSVIGQAPYLHDLLLGNRIVEYIANSIPVFARLNKARYIVQFAASQLDRYKSKDTAKLEYRDMLDRFKRYKDGVEVMSDKELLSHASSNIFAGSDTTAISLRSMFYYFCKTPHAYKKLVAEIDEMDTQGKLSNPITFAESNQMPYLQACMKEAMRMHPAVGLLLERVVPEGGATFAGRHLPAGTVVGANPWVVARDKEVYGDDAEAFRPERWLEADAARLKLMDRNYLAFGSGARTCLGKNISLLEMSKLVPQILRSFKVELTDPEKEWKLADYWFVKQTGLICRITRREGIAQGNSGRQS
jgi:cytochrome P450